MKRRAETSDAVPIGVKQTVSARVPDVGRLLEQISQLPGKERYAKADLLVEEFHLASEGVLEVFYAPLDHVNPDAKVALVGVTPGWTQMEQAFRAVRDALAQGSPAEAALAAGKRTAAFAGTMRRNLIEMLDGVGLARSLGLATTRDLFGSAEGLLHGTSAIRYPVFRNGGNYSGHGPRIADSPLLLGYVRDVLAGELAEVGQALVIPLGRAAESAIGAVAHTGAIDTARCLAGFPHPSGANPHRVAQYQQQRDAMAATVRAWFS
jgi:hypothetical protein